MKRLAAFLLCAGCAAQPLPPAECPDLERVVTATGAEPVGISAEARAYYDLAIEWRGEALTEAAEGDAAKTGEKIAKRERDEARAERDARVSVLTVVLWCGLSLAAGAAGSAVYFELSR